LGGGFGEIAKALLEHCAELMSCIRSG
jgi:hypothetical protein